MFTYASLRRIPLCFGMFFGLLLTLLAGCGSAPTGIPPELISLAAPAIENEEGLLVVDATAFQANQPRSKHSWQLQKDAGAVDGTEMAALRDLQVTLDRRVEQTSPRLDYRVRFAKAGTHYVWVHGQAAAGASLNGDSLHVGLNGKVTGSAKRITGFTPSYSWVNQTMAKQAATVYIGKPGTYTLNVWMREDGAQFDALALATDEHFVPSDALLAEPGTAPGVPEAPAPILSSPTSSVTPTRVAFSAQALRNSVGVNIHSTYDDTAYYDSGRIVSYLKELEPTWIREGVHQHPRAWHPGFLRDLKNVGFKLSVGVGDPAGTYGNFGIGDSDNLVRSLKTTYAGVYDQFELPNEWDLFSPTNNWVDELSSFYSEYYGALKHDPYFRGMRVVGPSFGTPNGPRTFAASADAANIHPYTGGTMPETDDMARAISEAKKRAGSGQVVATELGYHNAVNTSSGFRGVPESVAAHYLVRTLLWNFSQGVDQNYIYQLFDQKPNNPQRTEMEEWFGLVAVEGNPNASPSTWILRKKPAFDAVARLQSYLRDSGNGSMPDTLPFEVVGLPQTAVMLPVARKDGSYDIALWLENSLYERNSRTLTPDINKTVTLRFSSAVSVSSYRPSVSGAITQVSSNKAEVSVSVDGKVTFFRVRP